MGRWWLILGGDAGFLKITIINFTLRFLFDFLNMCRQTERFCITCYFSLMFLAYVILLKVFSIAFHLIKWLI